MTKAKSSQKKNKNTEQTKLAREISGVLIIVVGILFGIGVFSGSQTVVMTALRDFAFGGFGVLGYVCPFIFAAWGGLMIFADKLKVKTGSVVMTVVGILSLIALIHLLSPYGERHEGTFGEYLWFAVEKGCENAAGGGFIGALVCFVFAEFTGRTAGAVILIALILISVMVVCHISIKAIGKSIGKQVRKGAHIAAERIREEAPKREERLKQKVEREAFIYESKPEEEYPKGTAYNEVLEDEETLEAGMTYEERLYEEDFEEEPEEEPVEANFYPFDRQPEYELQDDSVVEGAEYETTEELDLAGLRIIDKMHGRRSDAPAYTSAGRKKSYDFTVEEQPEQPEQTAEQAYDISATQAYEYPGLRMAENYTQTEDEPPFDMEDEEKAEIFPEEEAEPAPVKRPQLHIVRPEVKEEKKFVLPPFDLLDKPRYTAADGISARNEIDEYARRLEDTFRSFGVDIKVVDASRGPKVTRYELQPAAGVKISKIKALGDDIALNMAAESVRIEAPIPGKSVIGIELPNKTYASVCVRELIDCPEFRDFNGELPFALGKDIAGKKIFDDLAKMPHLLVAGTTGSGKSVCLNTIIMSLIYKLTPSELQFIMIDPKMVEMAVYNDIPNLKVPVVMDKAKAAGALVWAVTEMENRYKLFQAAGVRNIKTYNQKRKAAGEEPMAKLVIVIDEFADLMMVSAKDVEDAVCRIAQLGRASGIHLIIATQSPRADIFTGLIKANVPSRIALTVGNALESRIIMDEMGAEKLLGYGDMLYRPIGKNKATRVQGSFVSDDEIYRVTTYLKSMGGAKYDDAVESEMVKLAAETGKNKQESSGTTADSSDMDELLPQAIETVLEFEQASASMLQRKMRVGYSRAARLMDQLEDIGAVGPSEGSKGRQILWTWADYNEHFGGNNDHEEEYNYED